MKVGDFVGWADTWEDETGLRPAGIVLEKRQEEKYSDSDTEWDENYAEFLILYQHNGQISWDWGSDLEVMFESR